MGEHTERFTGRVAEYEQYRQRYPVAAVLDVLRTCCGLAAGQVVADVGAGTGMLAEVFLQAGCQVLALEPNAEMRSSCERLLGGQPGMHVLDATAEATTLPPQSVDMVSVGRAFHWFDRERALAEFRRILRPGGWIVVVSSSRSKDGSDLQLAYEELFARYRNAHGGSREHEAVLPADAQEAFDVRLAGEQRLTLPALLGQTQSYSGMPLRGQPGHDALQAELQAFFARWQRDGVVTTATTCRISGWHV